MGAYLYIVRCFDDHYYVGTTRGSLETRVNEHNAGKFDGYTSRRRPVALVYHEWFSDVADAIAMERRVKGWSRAKKEALMRGDFEALKRIVGTNTKRR